MQRFIKSILTPTARSSAFYYFCNFAISFLRYLFHLLLLRLLLPADYGEFLAYLSLLYLLGIPNGTVSNVVIKYVAGFRGKKDNLSINELFYYLIEKLTPLSLGLGFLLIFFAKFLSIIFKAHPAAFVILGLYLFVSLVSTLVRSYLLAFQRFVAQILLGFLEIITTLILAFLFINLGLSATGAVLALILAGVVSLVICLVLIRKAIFPARLHSRKPFKLSSFTGYSLVNAIGSLSLISTDILLVRYFFSEHASGIYSSLSVIGRMIYFGLGPLIALVLPVVSHRHAATGATRGVFVKLGSVVLLFGLSATLIFSLFPEFIIGTLSGKNYLEAAVFLPSVATGMLFFSFNLFIITYFMAIGRPQINLYLLLATIAQPVLISVFHNSLNQVVWLNLTIETALFVSLIWQVRKQQI